MLTISAALCGTALLPRVTGAALALEPVKWRGVALGAPAQITLYAPERKSAEDILERALAELRRLEAVFSLYRADSALSRLNAQGELRNPPLDLVRLLSLAKGIATVTRGAFDPTIQPLWQHYAEHFARNPATKAPPPNIDRVLELVGHHKLSLVANRIAFEKPGMALSLNGIAQGYITDCVADILRVAGLKHVLVDLGEARGLDRHPSGRAWRAAIAAANGKREPIHEIELVDRAIATSAPSGTVFEPQGQFHHLLDPRTGQCSGLYQSVTVTAPQATLADAYSTAFAVMAWEDVTRIAAKLDRLHVYALDGAGDWREAGG